MATNEEYIKKNKVLTVDDDKNTKLHYAAAIGNYEEAEKYLATGQKLDCENYLGWTPLMMAIRNCNMTIATLLLDHRVDATKKNKFGMSVFMISVASGDLDMVTKILNHLLCGGISRQSLQKTLSPISLAIMFGHYHIFTYLIERSFDINASTALTGVSPLMFAAAVGNTKAIKKLLQHKADPKLKNYLGKTACEIVHSKNQKMEIETTAKPKTPRLPLIMISSYSPNSPALQLTPQYDPGNVQIRKSSNTLTPNICVPNVSPITSQFSPQIFFPPNFNPSQIVSPQMYQQALSPHDFLNIAINQSCFFSPSLQMCYPNSS